MECLYQDLVRWLIFLSILHCEKLTRKHSGSRAFAVNINVINALFCVWTSQHVLHSTQTFTADALKPNSQVVAAPVMKTLKTRPKQRSSSVRSGRLGERGQKST